jgi:dihydrofolate reductase
VVERIELSLIWAMTRNGVIGRDNGLPWRLPEDMKHFMATTRGHPVIMGRRTFESMDRKPLPHRTNIVVTRTPGYSAPGIEVVGSLDDALQIAHRQCREDGSGEVFVIGGAGLFADSLPRADRLYVTRIDTELAGDTVFPDIDWSQWRQVHCRPFPADERHAYPFEICEFERA